MKKIILTYGLLLSAVQTSAQQNTLLIQSYFKDQLFNNARTEVYVGSSFLPLLESDYNLNTIIRDSSIQYYDFTEVLFKRHLLDATGENYKLTISPIVDFSKSKDFNDTANPSLFQNTRGLFIEGDLLKNFSFMTSVYENQSRFNQYETSYYSSLGEMYPQGSNYVTQNAVIPGAGRTKPFKEGGFDYAYAIGNIVYRPIRSVALIAGNSSQFIGDGHRSLLLSDNSVAAPFFRVDYKISSKWEFNFLRSKLFNLMRRPVSTTVEAYYETKGYSVNYLTYKPANSLSISLFEGIIWSKGDSITSTNVHPLFYNPLPLVSGLIMSKEKVNTLYGLNLSFALKSNHRFYGQIGFSNLSIKNSALQIGYRGYNYFGLTDFMLQLEYNNVAESTYNSSVNRLNYSAYNLPMAHVKGNAFQEILIRSSYSYKRMYIDLKTNYFLLNNYNSGSLLPVDKQSQKVDGSVLLTQLEFGYRFNKLINLSLFASWLLRNEHSDLIDLTTNQFSIGLRTGILNHYNDF